MFASKRSRRAFGVAVVIAVVGGASSAIGAAGSAGTPTSGTAYVGQVPHPGSLVYDSGFNYDKVLGPGSITFVIKALPGGAKGTIAVKAKVVTLWTKRGSLSGTGSAILTITNALEPGAATIRNGKLLLNRGTGGMAGHSFRGTFTGMGTITHPNQYIFHYKGVYR
jgi:hypothetical protein